MNVICLDYTKSRFNLLGMALSGWSLVQGLEG